MAGLSPWAYRLRGCSTCQNTIPFYGWVIDISWCGQTTFCLSSHQLMNIWIVSTFWLWWIMLQWTLVDKYVSPVFNSLKYIPKSRTARDMVIPCLLSEEPLKHFHSSCAVLHSHPRRQRVPASPHPHKCLLFSVVLVLNYSHPKICEVVSHCVFYLHFLNSEGCWESFRVFIGHLYICVIKIRPYDFFLRVFNLMFILRENSGTHVCTWAREGQTGEERKNPQWGLISRAMRS